MNKKQKALQLMTEVENHLAMLGSIVRNEIDLDNTDDEKWIDGLHEALGNAIGELEEYL